MPNAPAPTWRTHDWCRDCHGPVPYENRVAHMSQHKVNQCEPPRMIWGPGWLAPSPHVIKRELQSPSTPSQRAAFEAWAKG